jgi:hypothetical protein
MEACVFALAQYLDNEGQIASYNPLYITEIIRLDLSLFLVFRQIFCDAY